MFELDYFGDRRYLSQTGQLYLEVLVPLLEKVWSCGPSFRAEPDVDGRHLCEFTLLEIEIKSNFEELLEQIENLMMSMINASLQLEEEIKQLGGDVGSLRKVRKPFKKITYTKAIELLSDYGLLWGDDLKANHERKLVELNGNVPLFVTHYPKKIKFFNMREDPMNPEIVLSADLLLPYSGEAVGAAEREFEYERLLSRLKQSTMFSMLEEKGGTLEDFGWYLNYYKEFGGGQHSGCGIGVNRVVQYIIGSTDIRSCTVWPMNRETTS